MRSFALVTVMISVKLLTQLQTREDEGFPPIAFMNRETPR